VGRVLLIVSEQYSRYLCSACPRFRLVAGFVTNVRSRQLWAKMLSGHGRQRGDGARNGAAGMPEERDREAQEPLSWLHDSGSYSVAAGSIAKRLPRCWSGRSLLEQKMRNNGLAR
jgi:hypothetical protein